jgi:hypothetical protein
MNFACGGSTATRDHELNRMQKMRDLLQKGRPVFSFEDRALIEDGFISAKYMYTIREGEPVRDNISERIVYTRSDIIKMVHRRVDRRNLTSSPPQIRT